MKRSASAIALVGLAIVSSVGVAKAEMCAAADLSREWLASFQMSGPPVACFYSVRRNGRIEGGCIAEYFSGPGFQMSGKLELADDCGVTGKVKLDGQGSYDFTARMAADKSTMAGLLVEKNVGRFFPVNVTFWPRSSVAGRQD